MLLLLHHHHLIVQVIVAVTRGVIVKLLLLLLVMLMVKRVVKWQRFGSHRLMTVVVVHVIVHVVIVVHVLQQLAFSLFVVDGLEKGRFVRVLGQFGKKACDTKNDSHDQQLMMMENY